MSSVPYQAQIPGGTEQSKQHRPDIQLTVTKTHRIHKRRRTCNDAEKHIRCSASSQMPAQKAKDIINKSQHYPACKCSGKRYGLPRNVSIHQPNSLDQNPPDGEASS